MNNWLHVYRREHNVILNEFWRSKVEETAADVINRYEQKINMYQLEINKLNNTIKDYEQQREIMIEDMKKVFLKGVTTMNIEALKYFKK